MCVCGGGGGGGGGEVSEDRDMNGVCVKLNEVTRQRHGKQFNTTKDNSFFQRKKKSAALGGIQTHNTLPSRGALNQLSYQGNVYIPDQSALPTELPGQHVPDRRQL